MDNNQVRIFTELFLAEFTKAAKNITEKILTDMFNGTLNLSSMANIPLPSQPPQPPPPYIPITQNPQQPIMKTSQSKKPSGNDFKLPNDPVKAIELFEKHYPTASSDNKALNLSTGKLILIKSLAKRTNVETEQLEHDGRYLDVTDGGDTASGKKYSLSTSQNYQEFKAFFGKSTNQPMKQEIKRPSQIKTTPTAATAATAAISLTKTSRFPPIPPIPIPQMSKEKTEMYQRFMNFDRVMKQRASDEQTLIGNEEYLKDVEDVDLQKMKFESDLEAEIDGGEEEVEDYVPSDEFSPTNDIDDEIQEVP